MAKYLIVNADDYGMFAQIGKNCTLYIDGEVQQSRM